MHLIRRLIPIISAAIGLIPSCALYICIISERQKNEDALVLIQYVYLCQYVLYHSRRPKTVRFGPRFAYQFVPFRCDHCTANPKNSSSHKISDRTQRHKDCPERDNGTERVCTGLGSHMLKYVMLFTFLNVIVLTRFLRSISLERKIFYVLTPVVSDKLRKKDITIKLL